MKKGFYKSLLQNLFYLLLCLSLAASATWLTVLYRQRHPSGSAEGSGWSGMSDALSMGVMAGIYLIMALICWAILIFRQRTRTHHPFLYDMAHLLLLAIVVFIYIALILQWG